MDLFESAKEEMQRREAPLATRMRPLTLQEFVGQKDVVGEGTYLRRAIEEEREQASRDCQQGQAGCSDREEPWASHCGDDQEAHGEEREGRDAGRECETCWASRRREACDCRDSGGGTGKERGECQCVLEARLPDCARGGGGDAERGCLKALTAL